MSNDDWTDDIEEILSKVRQNCIDMYKYHLCRYFQYKRILPVFRVPVLILNALNSVFSVGLQPYMEQSLISVLNCLISLIATLINSIEMYMGIQKSMESEMSSSQGFYILSIGIYKMLTLKRENRDINGKQYLMECYNTYSELVRNSKLIKDPYMLQKDFLQNVNQVMGGIPPSGLQDGDGGSGRGTGMEMITDYSLQQSANDASLKDVAYNLFSREPLPNLSRYLEPPLPPPPALPSTMETRPTDVESNQPYHPTFSMEGVLSHPLPVLQHDRRPSLTPSPTHPHPQTPHPPQIDSLYSLSRKNIFGLPPKRNAFLEMAGVDLRVVDVPRTDLRVVDVPSTNHQRSSSFSSSHLKHIFATPTPSVTSSPENSHHSHQPHDHPLHVPVELLQGSAHHSPQPPPPPPPAPTTHSPPAVERPSKEKGVKDIIQDIESSARPSVVEPIKPKKETSQNPSER
jgi:hypothetical protein